VTASRKACRSRRTPRSSWMPRSRTWASARANRHRQRQRYHPVRRLASLHSTSCGSSTSAPCSLRRHSAGLATELPVWRRVHYGQVAAAPPPPPPPPLQLPRPTPSEHADSGRRPAPAVSQRGLAALLAPASRQCPSPSQPASAAQQQPPAAGGSPASSSYLGTCH
jgi:hypothetical protein